MGPFADAPSVNAGLVPLLTGEARLLHFNANLTSPG